MRRTSAGGVAYLITQIALGVLFVVFVIAVFPDSSQKRWRHRRASR